jgi:hypothetical protein
VSLRLRVNLVNDAGAAEMNAGHPIFLFPGQKP